jgi:hypothetical protein
VGTSIILLLYFSALGSQLELVSHILIWVGIFLSVVLMGVLIYRKELGTLCTPGAIFFLVGSLLLYIVVNSDYYSHIVSFDDFSHWARLSKVIFLNHGLVQAADPVWYKDYPPGIALFHYYVGQFSGFSASAIFFASNLLILAACSQFLTMLPKYRWLTLIYCSLFLFFSIYYFGTGFHTLMVDLIISLLFSAGIIGYWWSERGTGDIIRILPIVLVLPIIKSIGLIFSCILIAVVIFDQLWLRGNKKGSFYAIFLASLLIPLLLLTYLSWQQYFDSLGVAKTFHSTISVEQVINAFNPSLSSDRQQLTIKNYIETITSPETIVRISLFLIAMLVICRCEKQRVKRGSITILMVVLSTSLVGYLFFLLITYMFFFGEYEGVRLASFSRYAGTYYVSLNFILFSMLVNQYLKITQEKHRSNLLGFLLVFSIATTLPSVYSAAKDVGKIFLYKYPDKMASLDKYSSLLSEQLSPSKKIFFVWQNSTGYEMQAFSYGVIPHHTNNWCWSVGEKYYPEDVWTCEMDIAAFTTSISEYDYLFVAHADPIFWKRYSLLFNAENTGDGFLYKVLKDDDTLRLIHIDM